MPVSSVSWAYFDTSVLVKTYVEEQGSRAAVALLRNHLLLSSALAPIELISVLNRRKASGEITSRQMNMLLSRIERERRHWTLINLDSRVLVRGESLCLNTTLRTQDALHLASAMVFQESSRIRVPFVTADARQRGVAETLVLDIVWVG